MVNNSFVESWFAELWAFCIELLHRCLFPDRSTHPRHSCMVHMSIIAFELIFNFDRLALAPVVVNLPSACPPSDSSCYPAFSVCFMYISCFPPISWSTGLLDSMLILVVLLVKAHLLTKLSCTGIALPLSPWLEDQWVALSLDRSRTRLQNKKYHSYDQIKGIIC